MFDCMILQVVPVVEEVKQGELDEEIAELIHDEMAQEETKVDLSAAEIGDQAPTQVHDNIVLLLS